MRTLLLWHSRLTRINPQTPEIMIEEIKPTTTQGEAVASSRLVRPRYYAKEYARGRWHVITPDRRPIYDDAPYGNDKPVIFRDEDAAIECAERCNMGNDGQVV